MTVLVDQLEFYWDVHLWPRLDGLTDEEYLWEPVTPCWSVRADPHGRHVLEGADQRPPVPPPFTTIAWRLVHIAADCFHRRASAFFGDSTVPADADMFDPRHLPATLPATAADALALLEHSYRWWHNGIASLDETSRFQLLGQRAGPYADRSMEELIAHINREVMHHGGEIGVLRDLYRYGFRHPDGSSTPQ